MGRETETDTETVVKPGALEVGLSVVFQNVDATRPDHAVYKNELRIADLAEPLGFDSVWTTEHHFTDYMLVPDPLQFLTYMAGRTKRVKLGSMVVVLPWHDPVRVAESVAMLDTISEGRFIFGVGRGAGDIEFEGFRVAMSESRDRFIEEAEMILSALETGVLEYAGKHHQQPRRMLRPTPTRTFKGRSYAGTLSPDAMPIMAKLGLGIMIIPQKPWENVARELAEYGTVFRAIHGTEPPKPYASAWIYCDEDGGRAKQMASRYMGAYYRSTIDHYKFDGKHFAATKGYEYYDKISKNLERNGKDSAADGFVDLQVWGTPDECYEKARAIQGRIGCVGLNGVFSYAGMPYEAADASLRLFAEKVMPRLQKAAP